MTLRHRVLVVDDETSMRELLEIILGGDGYEVQTRPDVDAAVACLGDQNFDAVLTDLRIGPDRDAGMRLLSWLSEHAPDTPAIMMTAYGSVETAIEAMKRGASDYIMKPFKNDEVRLVMRRAIEQRNLVRENVALKRAQA
ncbi:MAG TPA: response regulator, partial [Candidatus Hydrogenedentes bacterium]|nr:response regulator [Candidatus Hydrogenedentota bacterium]